MLWNLNITQKATLIKWMPNLNEIGLKYIALDWGRTERRPNPNLVIKDEPTSSTLVVIYL